MATELETTLARIGEKSRLLTERYRTLQSQLQQANGQIADLQRELAARDRELSQLRTQIEYLQVATTVAPDRESVERTRALISGLVRDIDRCIAELDD